MKVVKFFHFLNVFFFRNILERLQRLPPSIFLKFCKRMDVEKSHRYPFLFSALWEFLIGIIFGLKLRFLRPSAQYPTFVFLKTGVFSMRLFKVCFHRIPRSVFTRNKGFTSFKDSSRFSALCDIPDTIKKNLREISNFFPQFSVFFQGFPLRKMGILPFSVSEEWRFFRVFSGAIKLMKF